MNTLSLPGKVETLVEFASSAELLSHSTLSFFVYHVYGHHEEGQILQTRLSKDVHKDAHIRYKINNSCWCSRYIMQYAFNMLTKA